MTQARWVKMTVPKGEHWVCVDEDDEVLAQVMQDDPYQLVYASAAMHAISGRKFLTIAAGKAWAQRTLGNTYIFGPPPPNWPYAIAPCGGTP